MPASESNIQLCTALFAIRMILRRRCLVHSRRIFLSGGFDCPLVLCHDKICYVNWSWLTWHKGERCSAGTSLHLGPSHSTRCLTHSEVLVHYNKKIWMSKMSLKFKIFVWYLQRGLCYQKTISPVAIGKEVRRLYSWRDNQTPIFFM